MVFINVICEYVLQFLCTWEICVVCLVVHACLLPYKTCGLGCMHILYVCCLRFLAGQVKGCLKVQSQLDIFLILLFKYFKTCGFSPKQQ